jgi:hypothetical protein
MNTPQRGLGVTGKSSIPRDKIRLLRLVISLLNFLSSTLP